jgi:uncharacterized protein with NRDE domain
MCLVVLSLGQHPDFPLILAANRDEFYARPTRDADWWPDRPDVIGGRDLQAGGTWLAAHRGGRFATVTNFGEARRPEPRQLSRGLLVTGFLDGDLNPADYLDTIDGDAYAGFNLIVGDSREVAYLSNREDGARKLAPGVYGLSNTLLDGPWHKISRSKDKLLHLLDAGTINESALMRLMDDRQRAPAEQVETGRFDFATAYALTAPFIVLPNYGTRCTTVLMAGRDGKWRFAERRFGPGGKRVGETRLSFTTGTRIPPGSEKIRGMP